MSSPSALINQKDRIILLMKMKGPCLPVQIAKGLNVSTLFAGAFLSELYSEQKIKVSHMKVGSSPLYYLPGQENLLESFVEHLNPKEKEAFMLLKKEKVLDDQKQSPVTRVAIRALKDFAVPIRVRVNEEVKTFWKYFLLPDSEVRSVIEQFVGYEKISPASKKEVFENKLDEVKPETSEAKSEEKVKEPAEKKSRRKKIKIKDGMFSEKIKNYLLTKDMEILNVIIDKRKEFIAKARIDMLFGKQEFYIMAKDKKMINDNDLIIALQNAQGAKMPALFISNGKLNKKAEEYLNQWKNLLIFSGI